MICHATEKEQLIPGIIKQHVKSWDVFSRNCLQMWFV